MKSKNEIRPEILKLSKKEKLEWIDCVLTTFFKYKDIKITTSDSIDQLLETLNTIYKKMPFIPYIEEAFELVGDFHKIGIETLETCEIIRTNDASIKLTDTYSKEFIQADIKFESHRDITAVTNDILGTFIWPKYTDTKQFFFKPNAHNLNCEAFDSHKTFLKYPLKCNCLAKKILETSREQTNGKSK